MKLTKIVLVTAFAMAVGAGCASSGKDLAEQASKGPVVIEPRSNPETVELNKFLQPKQPQQFFAEIQDFSAPVTEARVKIEGTQIELPMSKVGGTTWRAELTTEQLKRLAISGKKMEYEANVVARNQNGVSASSAKPFKLKISAPLYEQDAG
jgi:hypothetical protein